MIENAIKMCLEENRADIALNYFMKLEGEEITFEGLNLLLIRNFYEWIEKAVDRNYMKSLSMDQNHCNRTVFDINNSGVQSSKCDGEKNAKNNSTRRKKKKGILGDLLRSGFENKNSSSGSHRSVTTTESTLVQSSEFEQLVSAGTNSIQKQIIHLTQLEKFQAAKKETNNSTSKTKYKVELRTLNSLCISLLNTENPIKHLKQICNHSLKIGNKLFFSQSFFHLIDLFKTRYSNAYVVRILDMIPKECLHGVFFNVNLKRDFLNAMAQRYISVNNINKGLSLIEILVSMNGDNLDGSKKLNRGVYIGLIHYYTNSKTLSFQEADRYYHEMISLGYMPNISVLTKLLVSMSKSRIHSLKEVYTFYLNEFPRCGIKLDLKVYNSLLKVCIIMADLKLSEQVIEKMKDTKLDLDTCLVLINLYTKLKRFDKIPSVLEAVGELERALNPYIHHAVEINETDQSTRINDKNRIVLSKIFKAIIQKLLVTNDLESVLYYLKVMKKFKIQIDSMIYSTVISKIPLEKSTEEKSVFQIVDEILVCLIDQENTIVYSQNDKKDISDSSSYTSENHINIETFIHNTNDTDLDQMFNEIISIITNDKHPKILNIEAHLNFYKNWIKILQDHQNDYSKKLYIITKVIEILQSKNQKLDILKYLFDIRSWINKKTNDLFYDRFFNINFCHVINAFDVIDSSDIKKMLLENFIDSDGFNGDLLLLNAIFERYQEDEYLEIIRGWLLGNPDLKTVRSHLRWVVDGNPVILKNLDRMLEILVTRANVSLSLKELLIKERIYISRNI